MTRIKCLCLLVLIFSVHGRATPQPSKALSAFYQASGIVADSKGTLYVIGKTNRVVQITGNGAAYNFAGSSRPGHKDGRGSEALFGETRGIAIDEHDNLYITDNTMIRKVAADGTVTTIFGNDKSLVADGAGKTASFKRPQLIAADSRGTLYVTDEIFDSVLKRTCNIVRKITPEGEVKTIKDADGNPFKANWIYALACDKSNNLYVSAVAWSSCITKITPDEVITVVAGKYDTNEKNRAVFKEGDVVNARLVGPTGIAIDKNGDLIFSDGWINRIIRISDGKVTTVAGGNKVVTGVTGGYRDGKASQALFQTPHGIAFDKAGNLYIVDNCGTVNGYIRKLSPDGMVTTVCKQVFNPTIKQYE